MLLIDSPNLHTLHNIQHTYIVYNIPHTPHNPAQSSSAGGGGRKNARIKDLSSTMPIKGKVYADDFEVVEKRGPGGTIVKAEFEDMFFRQEADDSNSSLAKVCGVQWTIRVLYFG
jgi:hypothetical protein